MNADFRGAAICLFRTHFLGWSGRFFHGCDGSFPRTRAPVPAAGSGEPLGTDAEPGPSLSDGVRGPSHPPGRVLSYATAKLLRDEAESMVPNIDPEQVRKLAGWGLTQNDIASFVGWSPQPSAVGPVPHQPGFLIVLWL